MDSVVRYSLDAPEQALALATDLQRYAHEKRLTVKIQGRDYAQVEAWQFAGGMLGLYPVVESVVNESNGKGEFRYRAEVALYDASGIKRGFGVAICTNAESTKKNFAEYAICSMAQTRAIGKAYRNLLAWVMRAAGFEPTPAEEMDEVKRDPEFTGQAGDYPMPYEKHLGKSIKDFSYEEIQSLLAWENRKGNPHPQFCEYAEEWLKEQEEVSEREADARAMRADVDQTGDTTSYAKAKGRKG